MESTWTRGIRSILTLAVVASLPLVSIPAAAADIDEPELSYEVKQALEEVLHEYASDLSKEGEEDGRSCRGTFSRKFRPDGDGRYRVAFTKDTAAGARLLTESYLLTLEKNSTGAWSITEKEPRSSYERLVRNMPGDETFRRFDEFRFDAEGMKVSASGGFLALDYLDGNIEKMVLVSDDLEYDYMPPSDLPYNKANTYTHLKERHPDDFVFTPEVVVIECDPGSCDRLLESAFTGLEESSRSALPADLEHFYDEQLKKLKEEREKNKFSGFRLPYEPDRISYKVMVKKKGKDHWLWLNYDSYEAWEVAFWVSKYGPLYGYISEEARKAGVKPYDVEGRDDSLARNFEVEALKGTVGVAIGHSELMTADVEFTMNLKRDCSELLFYLNSFRGWGGSDIGGKNPTMVINSLQDGDGNDLSWMLTGPTSGYVVFPDVLKAGTKLKLRMDYESRGSIIKYTPSFSYMDRSGWMPFVRFTDRIDDFEITIKAPSKYTVLGIGTKVSEETEGEVTTTHWKAQSPIAFPTFIFGDYYVAEPKIKATKLDGTEIKVRIYADKDGMADRGIRGKQLLPPAEQAVNSLNLYRDLYGVDYPYSKLDLVSDPVGLLGALYGQAPSSLIFLGFGVFRGEGVWGTATGEGDLTKALRSVTSHEVGHQWWGHTISNANYRNYWFIETFTEYASGLFIEAVASEGGKSPEKGWKAYLDKVGQWRDAVMNTDLVVGIQDASALYAGENGIGDYIAAVYNKGPYALHILRMTFGRDKMDEFLRTLMHEFRDKEIVARDIQNVAERVYGGSMDWFFDQWIRGVGIPEYSFRYDYRRTEDGNWLVDGTIRQRVVFGTQKEELDGVYFRGIVPITVLGTDKQEYSKRLLVEGPETKFALKIPVKPVEISLNKSGDILAYDILDNRDW